MTWRSSAPGYEEKSVDRDSVILDDPVPPEFIPDALKSPGVLIRRLGTQYTDYYDLDFLEQFFPDVPSDGLEHFEFPVPGSNPFWSTYSEPIDRIASTACDLASAVYSLITINELVRSGQDLEYGETGHVIQTNARLFLDRLASHCCYCILPTTAGSFQSRWVAPSPLAKYAAIAIEVLSSEFAFRNCEVCERLYQPTKKTNLYCSTRCRQTAQKRRQRARKKKKIQ